MSTALSNSNERIIESRVNMNRCARRHTAPDDIHGLVGYGDTAIGPVTGAFFERVVRLAVDHDVAARIDPMGSGPCPVSGVGVGNVDRQMVKTVGVAPIQDISTFGRALITAAALVTGRVIAQAYSETLDGHAINI